MTEKKERIAALNDRLRQMFEGGHVLITPGIQALNPAQLEEIRKAVQGFDEFNADNDPHRERDFGIVKMEGIGSVYWKIDYYDLTMQYGSEDPSDPEQTTRVLTIMLSHEY